MSNYDIWLQGWQVRQVQQADGRRAAIERARVEWVGCRVWTEGTTYRGYAWVKEIDDHGMVGLHLEDAPYGYPDHVGMKFEALGSAITHVD